MLKRKDVDLFKEFELELTEQQRAVLCSMIKQEPFDILQKLMEDQVRKFYLRLINTPVNKPEDVLAHHALAKGVAQFYAGMMDRIQSELQIEQFNNSDIGTPENPENTVQIEEIK
jgi:hypothetical protein